MATRQTKVLQALPQQLIDELDEVVATNYKFNSRTELIRAILIENLHLYK